MRFITFSFLLLFVLYFIFVPSSACPSHQSEPVFYRQYPPSAPRRRYSRLGRTKHSNHAPSANGHAHLILSRVQAIHSSVRSAPSTNINLPSNTAAHAQFILNRVGSIHQQVNDQQNTQQQQNSENNSSQPNSQQNNSDDDTQDSSPDEEKKGPPVVIIAVSAVGGVVLLIVAVGFIHWRWCRRSSSASEDSDSLYYKFDYNSTSLASGAGDDQDEHHKSGMYMEDEETGEGYPRKISKKKKGATTANASFVSTEDQIAAPRIDEDEVPSSGVAFLDTYGRPIAEPIVKS